MDLLTGAGRVDKSDVNRLPNDKISSLCGHAENIWKFLDDLASNDPEEYKNFIQRQAQAAGVELPAKGNRQEPRPHIPGPTLVILTTPSIAKEETLSVNVQKVAIALWRPSPGTRLLPPSLPNGQAVGASCTDVHGVRVPMAPHKNAGNPLGKPQLQPSFSQYDVEVSDEAMQLALENRLPMFRESLVELATAFVEARHNRKLGRTGRKLLIAKHEANEHDAMLQNSASSCHQQVSRAAKGTTVRDLPASVLDKLSSMTIGDSTTDSTINQPLGDWAAKSVRGVMRRRPIIQEL